MILTTHNYWDNINNSTKSYWRNVASKLGFIICTGRPDLREYKGTTKIRRASTGGKYGKSADIVNVDLNKILSETAFVIIK